MRLVFNNKYLNITDEIETEVGIGCTTTYYLGKVNRRGDKMAARKSRVTCSRQIFYDTLVRDLFLKIFYFIVN